MQSYNTNIQTFPAAVFAGTFGFTKREFFEIDAPADRDVPVVSFGGGSSTPPAAPAAPPAPEATTPPPPPPPPRGARGGRASGLRRRRLDHELGGVRHAHLELRLA